MYLSTLPILVSLVAALSFNAFAQEADDDDGEWATAADVSSAESAPAADGSYDGSTDSEFANDEEYASAYARYKAETTKKSEINRQRNEGFSRTVLLGIRGQAGINTFFGKDSDGWSLRIMRQVGVTMEKASRSVRIPRRKKAAIRDSLSILAT